MGEPGCPLEETNVNLGLIITEKKKKQQPAHKLPSINYEVKMRMIWNYGQQHVN